MGLGKRLKKSWNKHKRSIIGVATFGGSEIGRELSGYNQMKQMEELADEQARVQEEQLKQAQRQANIDAANSQQIENSGTSEALAKILQKRSALQRSIRTGGQQRLGD